MALGYWRQPEETAARFVPDPGGGPGRLFRTGDRGQWRPDGALALLGRVDTQVKVRGNRVEPAEVEAALIDCSGVRAVTVAVRPDRTGDPRLVAYVVGGTPPPSPGALREALAARLPAYMIPPHFVLLDALPVTLNGKVDVQALPPPPAARPALTAPCVDPRDPLGGRRRDLAGGAACRAHRRARRLSRSGRRLDRGDAHRYAPAGELRGRSARRGAAQ